MTNPPLDKTYDPKVVESRWYQLWDQRGFFHASPTHPGQPYCIVIPPPNVTGSLHVGHALNNSIQDILIRWRRMQGRNVLWMPGMDHAGIATQNVVERQLVAEGTSREQLGREKFIERVWAWKAQFGGIIIQQLKRLGASCDWARLRFTMDEGLSKAVLEVFVRLYEDNLIYRGERLINWCPRCLTALSDIEVEHEEIKGKLHSIQYPLEHDPATHLTVATTRPETMLGDTAVAVHPEDTRYRHLIGKRVGLPLTNRTIPIVGDSMLVDRHFGTGAVKITPAHDFNDFEAGERHHLPRLPILDHQGLLDRAGLQAAGVEAAVIDAIATLPVMKARPKIEQALKERGLLVKVEDHKMALGKCYRCKTVVSASFQKDGPTIISAGCGRSKTGASRARFGGDIRSPPGIAVHVMKTCLSKRRLRLLPPRASRSYRGPNRSSGKTHRPLVLRAVAKNLSEIPTCLTPGSHLASGPSPPLVGRSRPLSSKPTTPPRHS